MEESSLLFSLLSIKKKYIGVSKFFFFSFSQNLKMKKAGKNFVWVRGYMLKGLLHQLQVKVLELIMYK